MRVRNFVSPVIATLEKRSFRLHPRNKHHRFLIGVKKAKRRLKTWDQKYVFESDLQTRRDTGQPCSCWMCGNPRKHFSKLTIQEIKALEAAVAQLEERLPCKQGVGGSIPSGGS